MGYGDLQFFPIFSSVHSLDDSSEFYLFLGTSGFLVGVEGTQLSSLREPGKDENQVSEAVARGKGHKDPAHSIFKGNIHEIEDALS